MLNGQRIAVILPAYNAAQTLARTVAEIDRAVVDDMILTDDASTDGTVKLSRVLELLDRF
jgi:glycosyltransferase involved in cell wall biosynthesis